MNVIMTAQKTEIATDLPVNHLLPRPRQEGVAWSEGTISLRGEIRLCLERRQVTRIPWVRLVRFDFATGSDISSSSPPRDPEPRERPREGNTVPS